MPFLFYLCIIIVGLYVSIEMIYSMALLAGRDDRKDADEIYVSVLVAARNEEECIVECLEHLSKLNYPQGKIEILIGDDGSTDSTAQKIHDFIEGKTGFRYYLIEEQFPGIKGKQNVLAHLARKARGDIFLVTDADVQVNPEWATSLVSELKGNTGMVTGPTIARGKGLFAGAQGLDWLMGMSLSIG